MRNAEPPAWCRTAEQREAWRAGYKAALQDIKTDQLPLFDTTEVPC